MCALCVSSPDPYVAPSQALQADMGEHLQLSYQSEQTSDEQVLSIYPNAIRRKVCMGLETGFAAKG